MKACCDNSGLSTQSGLYIVRKLMTITCEICIAYKYETYGLHTLTEILTAQSTDDPSWMEKFMKMW